MTIKPIKLIIVLIISSLCLQSFAQKNNTNNSLKYTASNKGKFFITWKGNREPFAKSHIRFYDFAIIEPHFDPANAKSDVANMLHLDNVEKLLTNVAIRKTPQSL